MKVSFRAIALTLATALAAGVAGAALMYVTSQPPIPQSLQEAQPANVAPVVLEDFSDPQSAEATVNRAGDEEIRVPGDGLLTSSSCAVGSVARSGEVSFALNGTPLLNFHTGIPLWRDLTVGLRGTDVDVVKAELGRLGLATSSGPQLNRADVGSFAGLLKKSSVPVTAGVIARTSVLWLPRPEVSFASCDSQVNATLNAGDVVAKAAGGVTVSLTSPSDAGLPGARVAQIDGQKIPLTETRDFADPAAALSVITNTSSYRDALAEAEAQQPITVKLRTELNEPAIAAVLPPSSIALRSDMVGCVKSGKKTYEVTVLGSQLGGTIVSFTDPPPDSVSTRKPDECK